MNVLVGYLAATRATRPDCAGAGLPDGDIVSMSECLVDVFAEPPWELWFTEPPAAPPGHHVLAVGVPDHYLTAGPWTG